MDRITLKDVAVDSLKPYNNNNLDHTKNVDHIKNSLAQFGYIKTSIVVDEKMTLLTGHGTLQAVKLLEWQSIPEVIQIMGLDEQTKSAYRIEARAKGA